MHPQEQALGVDEHVAFASAELLGAVIASRSADAGRFDRLAVDDARTGLGVAADLRPQPLAQCGVNSFPGAACDSREVRKRNSSTAAGRSRTVPGIAKV
jgi:hypothetical protein